MAGVCAPELLTGLPALVGVGIRLACQGCVHVDVLDFAWLELQARR